MKPSDWPRLPTEIGGMAGPIPIGRPVKLPEDAMGMWDCEERRIRVRGTLSREVAFHVLLHELTHSALDDSGLRIPDEMVEPLCDTMASAMLHVVRHLLESHRPD